MRLGWKVQEVGPPPPWPSCPVRRKEGWEGGGEIARANIAAASLRDPSISSPTHAWASTHLHRNDEPRGKEAGGPRGEECDQRVEEEAVGSGERRGRVTHHGELLVVLAVASITVGRQQSKPHGRVGRR